MMSNKAMRNEAATNQMIAIIKDMWALVVNGTYRSFSAVLGQEGLEKFNLKAYGFKIKWPAIKYLVSTFNEDLENYDLHVWSTNHDLTITNFEGTEVICHLDNTNHSHTKFVPQYPQIAFQPIFSNSNVTSIRPTPEEELEMVDKIKKICKSVKAGHYKNFSTALKTIGLDILADSRFKKAPLEAHYYLSTFNNDLLNLNYNLQVQTSRAHGGTDACVLITDGNRDHTLRKTLRKISLTKNPVSQPNLPLQEYKQTPMVAQQSIYRLNQSTMQPQQNVTRNGITNMLYVAPIGYKKRKPEEFLDLDTDLVLAIRKAPLTRVGIFGSYNTERNVSNPQNQDTTVKYPFISQNIK